MPKPDQLPQVSKTSTALSADTEDLYDGTFAEGPMESDALARLFAGSGTGSKACIVARETTLNALCAHAKKAAR